jgi:EAL domain-containing protein (putative c-di-GMP-specific phosphodiesterase class I)
LLRQGRREWSGWTSNWSGGQRKDRRGTLVLAAGLVDALERDEIERAVPAPVRRDRGAIVGAEALARWRHPEQALMAGRRCSSGRKRGLVVRLSHHVARVAMAAAARWPRALRLSLNVTAADLAERTFVGHPGGDDHRGGAGHPSG